MPRLLIWLDNLLVDMYTLLFIAVVGRSHARMTANPPLAHPMAATAFTFTLIGCVAGAVADHSENFWLLARIGSSPNLYFSELNTAVIVSEWKYRLLALNIASTVLWFVLARRHQHRPVPTA